MHITTQLSVLGLVLGTASTTHAQVAPPPPTAAQPASGGITIGASGFAGLPIGDFGKGLDLGIGALLEVSYNLQPQIDLVGRAGFIYFLLEDNDGGNATFYDIPLWLGARYFLAPGENGPFLHGELGLNSYHFKVDSGFGSASDSETEIAVNLLGGIRQGKLIAEGGLYVGALDDVGDSMMIGGTVGMSF